MATDNFYTGKKGGVITYRVGDTMLCREYNPHPANPRTERQVAHRAKIKLLSQISAIFRFFIAIFPTSGSSSRAIFARLNYPNITALSTTAEIDYTSVSLTDSNRPLPQVEIDVVPVETGFRPYIHFLDEPKEDIQRAFYYLFTKTDNGKLSLVDYYLSERRTTPTATGFFNWASAPIEVDTDGKSLHDYVVFAIGMGDNSEEATEHFRELDVDYLEKVAWLIKENLITSADYYFTETRSLSLFRGH